jgi:hypothetical protein
MIENENIDKYPNNNKNSNLNPNLILNSNIDSTFKKKMITNKLICLILGLILFILYRIFQPNKDTLQEFPYQFCDKFLLNLFEGFTIFLSKNLQLRDFFLLTGFLNLDILLLTFLMHYIKFGNSIKPLFGFLLFYGLRGLIQTFYLLDYYPIYLFNYPGFRSLSVPTSRAADFFYSGHTGCAFLVTLNLKEMGEFKLFIYGCFVTFMQMIVMTVSRAHYCIDVIFGLIVSHYCFIIANDYEVFLNKVFVCFASEEENYQKGYFKYNKYNSYIFLSFYIFLLNFFIIL